MLMRDGAVSTIPPCDDARLGGSEQVIDHERRAWLLGAGCAMLLATTPGARAQGTASIAGDYTHSQMELVAGLRLSEDGTFRYALTVGSLDEQARGRWARNGNSVELVSDPRPVAPTVIAGRIDPAVGEPFGIRVLTANGRDVPGIDFVVEFDNGAALESSMPGDRWTLPEGEKGVPRFVTFAMPSYRLRSERLPLDGQAGRTAVFTFVPNDFGVADLTGARIEINGEKLKLHRDGGTMEFRRIKRSD